ncbi:GTP-binding protein Era [Moorella glycerini]|uniref:GTPase Era n=1 Tax=Neomoorella stamsii TaxID=1266720 RepID=A0A9X7P7Q2_9FIRM|nr:MULTISPECIES: GTPase Era [Moorella]PRR77472.1 GTPase Era [Moorella stamsii]CEP68221.1 GTP-binding protein Era [Moorella glycerini]
MTADYVSGFAGLIGRPNAGKSTLLNRLVGRKIAIMSDKPQTTRNKILGVLTTDSYQIVFLDTPGIHKPQHQLGEYMVAVARNTLAEVDVVLYVVDAAVSPGAGEEYIIAQLKEVATPKILILNKIDLVDAATLEQREEFFRARLDFKAVQAVSALAGTNVAALPELISPFLPPGPQYYPPEMVTDQPEKFVMAELIREQVLRVTREEVPHAVAVVVEEIAQRPNDYLYVDAVIYVERDSQKGIIIGQGGQRLKEIGTQARQEMEALLGSKIFLNLRVRVKKNWRQQELALRQLGYDRRLIQ